MKKQIYFKLCIGLLCLCSLQTAEAKKKKEEPASTVSMTLGYLPDKQIEYYQPQNGKPLLLDVFLPENYNSASTYSCIVFFFGGGWINGDNEQFYVFSKYMASRGLVSICAQYRTQKSHNTKPRACVEDGKEAIRYIREHAEELGIDPDKIIAGGGSAGGHVAAACAMCTNIDRNPESPISCVPNVLVLLNPVYDNGPGGYGHSRVKEYWEDISPLHNMKKGLPPTIVFFGTKDKYVPVKTIDTFQKSMVENGNECVTHIYEEQSHGFWRHIKGVENFTDVLMKMDSFLVSHGYLVGENTANAWVATAMNQNLEDNQAELPGEDQ